MAEAGGVADKLKVFISYSRDDLEFVDQLEAILTLAGYETLIDRDDIAAGEAWEPRLGEMMADCDTVVFVVSPSSVNSPVCSWELEEARRLAKRIIPVACRPLGSSDEAPSTLAALNYIFFYPEPRKSGTGFAPGLTDLAKALNTDVGWLRDHTRYLQRATDWDKGGRQANRLLVGSDIEIAKEWVANRPTDAPELTPLQHEFFRASELEQISRDRKERKELEEKAALVEQRSQAVEREQAALEEKRIAQEREAEASRAVVRRTRIGLLVATALALIAGVFGIIASYQEGIAEREARRSRATLTAVAAQGQLRAGDPTRALRFAQAALAIAEKEDLRPVHKALTDGYARVLAVKGALYKRKLVHDHAITHVAYSPDGARILTTASDGLARLWDRSGSEPIEMVHETTDGQREGVVHGTFTPDGERILTVGYGAMVRMWTRDGALVRRLVGHREHPNHGFKDVHRVVVGPGDGKIVTVSADSLAILWNSDGEILRVLDRHNTKAGPGDAIGYPRHAAFSADGTRFATAGWDWDRTVQLFDGAGNHLAALKEDPKSCPFKHQWDCGISQVAFDPHGEFLLTASADSSVRKYDLNGTLLGELEGGHEKRVWSVAFSPDGSHFVTASDDGTAIVWNRDGRVRGRLHGHTAGVNTAVFSPNGSLVATASSDRTARLWDLDGADLAVFQGHQASVGTLAFAPDGKELVTGSRDKLALVWPLGPPSAPRFEHASEIVSAHFLPDGERVLTASNDMTARLWEASGTLIRKYTGFGADDYGNRRITSLSPSPDGRHFVTTGTDYQVRIWDVESGKIVETLDEASSRGSCTKHGWCGARSATYSDDGRTLVVSDYAGNIEVRDADGRMRHEISGYGEQSPNGHRDEVSALAVHGEKELLATGSHDRTIKLWDLESGALRKTLVGHGDVVRSVRFSPDGASLVSASHDQTIMIWNLEGNVRTVIRGHDDQVVSADFSADGKRIISTSSDGSARTWDLAGNPLSSLHVSGHPLTAFSEKPDGRGVLVASQNGTAIMWPTTDGVVDWLGSADAFYELTPEDWRELGLEMFRAESTARDDQRPPAGSPGG